MIGMTEIERRAEQDARERTIVRLVTEHGTQDQRRRMAAGVMPREEALAVCRSALLSPLCRLGLEPFEKLTRSDLGDRVTDVEFDSATMIRLSAEQFALVEKVREVLPDGHVCIDWHEAKGVDERGKEVLAERNSLYVSRTVGGLTVSRRYAAPDTPMCEGEEVALAIKPLPGDDR